MLIERKRVDKTIESNVWSFVLLIDWLIVNLPPMWGTVSVFYPSVITLTSIFWKKKILSGSKWSKHDMRVKVSKSRFVIVQDWLSVKRHCSLPHNSKLTYGFMEGQQNVNSSLSIESQSIIDVAVNKWWEISMRALHLYGNLKEASAVSLTPRSKSNKTSWQRNTE